MTFHTYSNARDFLLDCEDILMENEAQNNLMLGLALDGRRENTPGWIMATVKDGSGGILLSALCTPPHNLILYATGNRPAGDALDWLVRSFLEMDFGFPGTLGEKGLAQAFASAYCGAKNLTYKTKYSMNIMKLETVIFPESVPGSPRFLGEEDLFFVPYWEIAFHEECDLGSVTHENRLETVKKRLGKDTHLIWVDKHPVAQAVISRRSQNGATVNSVYTPPNYRNRGYAGACVAALSQNILDRGYKFCSLFADAAYPASNRAYQKIGYRDICIYDEIAFADPAGAGHEVEA